MCGDEVFQNVQSFTEVRLNRKLDGTSGRVCHQTTHAGQLFDLLITTTGTGVCHHVNIVVFVQCVHQSSGDFTVSIFPCTDHAGITFFFCQKAHTVVALNCLDCLFCFFNDLFLLFRNSHIRNRNSECRSGCIFVTHALNIIEHFCGYSGAMDIDNSLQDLLERFLVAFAFLASTLTLILE